MITVLDKYDVIHVKEASYCVADDWCSTEWYNDVFLLHLYGNNVRGKGIQFWADVGIYIQVILIFSREKLTVCDVTN